MCTEMQNPTIKVVHRGSISLLSNQRAKSVIIKLKQWMRKLKKIDGGKVRGGREDSMMKNPDAEVIIIEEQNNADNENKLNIVKSKMAYTVEELKNIVDDNLANELREIRSRSARK